MTGITVFFDFMVFQPFYLLHIWLFYLLLILVVVNITHMLIVKFMR